MKATLGIDTSCGFTVLGLAEGNRVTAESRWELGRAQASLLPSLVRQVLQPFHLTLEDLEVLAVTVGPGAYTGLRIGVAYAAALADALGIRVVPLSTLEVLAEEAPPDPAAPATRRTRDSSSSLRSFTWAKSSGVVSTLNSNHAFSTGT